MFGINNIARLVKKAYIGVNNLARLFFRFGTISKPTISNLSVGRNLCEADVSNNYHIILGGNGSSSSGTKVVETYNKTTLARGTAANTSRTWRGHAHAHVNGNAIFAGGSNYYSSGDETYATNTVKAYDDNLTEKTLTNLSVGIIDGVGCSFKNYAMIAGGYIKVSNQTDVTTDYVNCYNSSLVKTTVNLSVSGAFISSAITGNYALFAGGSNKDKTRYNIVDAFNASLVRTSAPNSALGSSSNRYA